MTPFLSLRHLSRRFGATRAVDDVSLDIAAGEIHGLIGPSGCGKSTLLRMIAGFENLDSGEISLSGERIEERAPERRGIGIVFQDYALFPHMTVAGNLNFAMKAIPRRQRPARIAGLLAMVKLEGLEKRYPDQLSGGQQQRVALARTFASAPRLMLLDEPFSNLDAGLREAAREEVRGLLKATGLSILLVTHDREEALTFCDRISVMKDGRIRQTGTPALVYDRPVESFVAGFLGPVTILAGKARGEVADTAAGCLAITPAGTGDLTLALRPESLVVASEGELRGTVTTRSFRGARLSLGVMLGGLQITVEAEPACAAQPGEPIALRQRAPAIVLAD
ncbi:spermidine/putrescine ABC transporter ATPase [Aureimonas sp. SA4125]|uniref:ABC transporter ATP-binding protein n=1 Tax=Aureimonas sp. SA4125 TaxID=2826993 RepID=UPI001CC37253|nr:ABC transporter ATP-binding protein [Aureimonas sp. SA4125]BDA83622.1 spermidine/putrescine ABC transporter ATPase [Aureimonas sp. SA4125]